jgi:oligopeptide/dipeptide ABC transporter ATP-binding protein
MTGRFIEPLQRESTPSIIADKIRAAIGHGEISAGTQLVEAELARELGVSRGPLREGLQRLTQEGLLVAIRNRGVFVIEMTPENVRDMYIARSAVERAAAEQLFARQAHPYTEALLRSVPRPDRLQRGPLPSIPGLPPNLADLPPGCSFEPRCPLGRGRELCKTVAPPAILLGPDDAPIESECHFARERYAGVTPA